MSKTDGGPQLPDWSAGPTHKTQTAKNSFFYFCTTRSVILGNGSLKYPAFFICILIKASPVQFLLDVIIGEETPLSK